MAGQISDISEEELMGLFDNNSSHDDDANITLSNSMLSDEFSNSPLSSSDDPFGFEDDAIFGDKTTSALLKSSTGFPASIASTVSTLAPPPPPPALVTSSATFTNIELLASSGQIPRLATLQISVATDTVAVGAAATKTSDATASNASTTTAATAETVAVAAKRRRAGDATKPAAATLQQSAAKPTRPVRQSALAARVSTKRIASLSGDTSGDDDTNEEYANERTSDSDGSSDSDAAGSGSSHSTSWSTMPSTAGTELSAAAAAAAPKRKGRRPAAAIIQSRVSLDERDRQTAEEVDPAIAAVALSRERLLVISGAEMEQRFRELSQSRNLTAAEQKELRRQRRLVKNREYAQHSRNKRKVQEVSIEQLQSTIGTLEERIQSAVQLSQSLGDSGREIVEILMGQKEGNNNKKRRTNSAVGSVVLFVMLFSFGLFLNSGFFGTSTSSSSSSPSSVINTMPLNTQQQATAPTVGGGGGAFKTGRVLQGIESDELCLDSALLEMMERGLNDTSLSLDATAADSLPSLVSFDSL